mmetsp:Transcript_26024/g.85566  ORF Transcript_26024/g.85566 Transcript_26024/m.85566 type:complete len:228 (+) Transcript_26024:32-715(+)
MVDLPEPLSPTSANDLPAGTLSEKSVRMAMSGRAGYAKLTLRTSTFPSGAFSGTTPSFESESMAGVRWMSWKMRCAAERALVTAGMDAAACPRDCAPSKSAKRTRKTVDPSYLPTMTSSPPTHSTSPKLPNITICVEPIPMPWVTEPLSPARRAPSRACSYCRCARSSPVKANTVRTEPSVCAATAPAAWYASEPLRTISPWSFAASAPVSISSGTHAIITKESSHP